MILQRLSILNYKNIQDTTLDFSPKINCLVGHNGEGKTNLLDAVYYLSFCKSAGNPVDSQNIRHEEDCMMIRGDYSSDDGKETMEIYCGLKRRQSKQFKKDGKKYTRLSDHIGRIPLVMVSPSDSELIDGGSECRRKFIDLAISQYDRPYLDALTRYGKALQQRNALLKMEEEPDEELLDIQEEIMTSAGEELFQKRAAFIQAFIPVFREFYGVISKGHETVELTYLSHCTRGPLREILKESRPKDRIMGYSLHGVHKDDLVMTLDGYPIKKEGSQGQNKTYLIALKLAQFDFLRNTGTHTQPLLLLDDIFDKLDAHRVEEIVKLVGSARFGQIFITDTNRTHIDRILGETHQQYKLFSVKDGEITPLNESHAENQD